MDIKFLSSKKKCSKIVVPVWTDKNEVRVG